MANFLVIALCIFAGIFFRKSGKLPKDAHKGINAWIINIALPAVSFKYLPHIQFTTDLIFPLVSPIIVWVCGWLYFVVYAKTQSMSKATLGGLKLTGSLSNTSFIGFPLIIAYFGEKEIGTAILCDQVTFALLSTIGIVVAVRSSQNQQLDLAKVVKKVFSFPPIWGFILSLTVPRFVDISLLDPLFDKLAATVGPLALFSIALQIKFGGWFSEIKHLSFALFYKLMLAPLIVFAVSLAFGLKGMVPKIAIFEAAMPTLLTAGIVAVEYNLNPKLANLVVGVSIALCFITTALWFTLLTYGKFF